MIELRITGVDAQEFGIRTLQTLALIVNGAKNTTVPRPPANDNAPAETVAAEPVVAKEEVPVAEPMANPKASDPPPEEAPKRRGRPPAKKAQQIDLEEKIAETPPKPAPAAELDDSLADLTGKPDAPAPKHTIEDCKNAVRAIYDNFERRAREAGEKDEKKIMADKVAYAKQFANRFGVVKIADLKPEQIEPFMQEVKAYIDGTAKFEVAA
jgi:hypothetical protein